MKRERAGGPTDRAWSGPTAVLFDLDDTIYDHQHSVVQAIGAVRRNDRRLRGRTLRDLVRQYGVLLEQSHVGVISRRVDPTEARSLRWSELYRWAGFPISKPEARRISTEYRHEYLQHERPLPGVARFLERLARHARLGIVSNNLRREQKAKLEALGLTSRFRTLVTSEDAGAAKPDREIFVEALRRLGSDAEATAFVGDSWVSDVLGARNAGLAAIWFNPRGLPSPDPSLALELRAYTPLEEALDLVRTSVVLEED